MKDFLIKENITDKNTSTKQKKITRNKTHAFRMYNF